jgi:hypothetical protein
MTTYTASTLTTVKHPVTGKTLTGYFVLENGRRYTNIAYATRIEAEETASAMNTIRCAKGVL